MSKNLNITDFFKQLARSQVTKRPLQDDDLNNARSRKSRSYTSKRRHSPENKPTDQVASPISLQQGSTPDPTSPPLRDSTMTSKQGTPKENLAGSDGQLPEKSLNDQLASMDPSGSQGRLLTSSQRVVKNGEVVIRNSDDDESDSGSSLDDIDHLLRSRGLQNPAVSPPLTELGSSTPYLTERSSPEELGSPKPRTRATTKTKDASHRPTVVRPPKYKFDLSSLVQRSVKSETMEASIIMARKTLESIEQQKASKANRASEAWPQDDKIDEGLISSVFKTRSESNEVERLITAIQRTEALQQEKSWSFFETEEDDMLFKQPPFPTHCLDPCPSCFKNRSWRQQAFLGGYVTAMASKQQLPDEIVSWLVDAACFEFREDLRLAYAETIKEATKQITSLITPERIITLFSKIGAKQTAVDLKRPIVPVALNTSNSERVLSRPRLDALLTLIRYIAVDLSVEARSLSISLLCRLLIDQNITRNPGTNIKLENTLEVLFDSIPNDTTEQELLKISQNLISSITDITLRSRLVHNIPASSSSLSLFRRRLCLAFFLNDAGYLSKESAALVNLGSLSHHLTRPSFNLGKDTDFTELTASIAMLSIGVDNGDPPLAGFNSTAVRLFDEAIDMLSYEVKSMNDRIVDTGASHMKRTQAKQVLEGFHSRLQYAIRVRPPPKKSLLGDMRDDVIAKQASFMKKHIIPSVEAESPSLSRGEV